MNQSTGKYAIVITSIASPNGVIKAIAKKCSADRKRNFLLSVIPNHQLISIMRDVTFTPLSSRLIQGLQ
jgi:hypothetical protein